jgi:hypothetical protein
MANAPTFSPGMPDFTGHAEFKCRLAALMKLLVKRLAIPLSNQKTVAKWLVIAIRLGRPKAMHSQSTRPPEGYA